MSHSSRAWWLLLAAGCLASVASLWLPWHSEDLRLGVGVRLVMTAAGAVLLARVARTPDRSAPVVTVGVLGAGVVAYPTLLSLAAAELPGTAGAVLGVLGAAGHVLPLTLVQLAPVLVSREVVGRAHRRWEAVVVAVAVVGATLVGLGLGGVPGAPALLAISTILWFGSFLLAPVATTLAVRGTTGGTRHRALVAVLAALAPVVVISWCLALGVLAADLGQGVAVGALIVGFAIGTCACGFLVMGARGPAGSPVLRTRVVLGSLHAVVGALVLIVGTVAALTAEALGLPTAWAVLLGALSVLAAGPPWLRLHAWTRRVVDPAAALRHELSLAVGPDGHHRQALLHALRRVTGDAGLAVSYDGEALLGSPGGTGTVLARHPDGSPAARAHAPTAAGVTRLAALGDCTDLMRPAVLEARLDAESRRADLAAEAERRRVTQDLHDGLQGRLLGLALRLQLGARTLDDPGATLLAEETVEQLRAAVEDVRALGGGGLPRLLAREGLRPALSALFAPVASVVDLDLPDQRLAGDLEATVYFVVGEAVTNALKHGGACRVRVVVGVEDPGRLSVRVTDDGRGGADPRLGSGLRGLGERVSAAGGVLVVHDAEPGTTLEAVLPCGS